jgi:hypothetical protein
MSLRSSTTTQDDVLSAFTRQTTLALLIEHLVEGAALFDAAGSLLEMNDALFHLLEQEPERARLERALLHAFDLLSCRQLTRANAGPGAAIATSLYETELRTFASRYRIRAIVAGADAREGIRPIIVLVQMLVRRACSITPSSATDSISLRARCRSRGFSQPAVRLRRWPVSSRSASTRPAVISSTC